MRNANVCPLCGSKIDLSWKQSVGHRGGTCPACKTNIALRNADILAERSFFIVGIVVSACFTWAGIKGLIPMALGLVAARGYRHFFTRIVTSPSSHQGAFIMDKSVDPIKEADVYLTYGRHTQAAQVLESAIREDPTREDLRSKLAAINRAARPPASLSTRQSTIVFALLIVAATLKFFVDDPIGQIVGGVIGLCATLYLAVCFATKRRA